MTDNLALCICSTWAWTRITTLVVYTCLLTRTVRIDNTFRSAVWWSTYISTQTRTGRAGPRDLALGIWPTRVWYTWILRNYRHSWRSWKHKKIIFKILKFEIMLKVLKCITWNLRNNCPKFLHYTNNIQHWFWITESSILTYAECQSSSGKGLQSGLHDSYRWGCDWLLHIELQDHMSPSMDQYTSD